MSVHNTRISLEFLQQIVQALPSRVAVLDDTGKIAVRNQAWLDYCIETGLSPEKFDVGGDYLQLCRKARGFCRENGPKASKGIESVMKGRQDSFYLEYPCPSSNQGRSFQMRISRFHYGGKSWILVSHENLAEHKQADAMLGRLRDELEECLDQRASAMQSTNREVSEEIAHRIEAEQALREEHKRFRILVETIPNGIVEHSLDGIITFANAEFHRMHEYPEETLVGKCLWDVLKPFFPDAKKIIQKIILEPQPPTQFFHSFTTPTGKSVDYRIDRNSIRDDNGNITGIVAIITDITRQRQAEEEARQHLNQLAHVTRVFTMSQMVSGLAHELNQPLAAIANFAQACRYRIRKSSIKDRSKLLESIEQISLQADRAGQIIRRLRDFVRRADSSRSPENINDLVDNVAKLLETEARAHNIRLEKVLAPSLPPVAVDRVQIEQVITNLAKNALDVSRDLSPDLRLVTLRTEKNAEGMLQVSVIDSGKGIPADKLGQVFEPFYTTKQSGMGLGLSISRSIVEIHGGQLDAVRNMDRGMTFRFVLPIATEGGKA